MVAGVNTSTDPKVQTDGLLVLENARVTRKGEIRKRYGTYNFDPDNERFLASYNDRPVLIDADSLKVHNGATYKTGTFDPIAAPRLMETEVIRHETQGVIGSATCAESDSVRVVCWVEGHAYTNSTSHHIATYDLTTGRKLDEFSLGFSSSVQVYAGPVAVWSGNRLFAFYSDSNGILFWHLIDDETGEINVGQVLNSGNALCNPDYPLDACALGDGSYTVFMVMRCDDVSGAGDLRVVCFKYAGTIYTNIVVATDVRCVGCYKSSAGVGVAIYADGLGASAEQLYVSGWTNQAVNYNAAVSVWTAANTTESCYTVSGARENSDEEGSVYFSFKDTSHGTDEHQFETWRNRVNLPIAGGAATCYTAALFKMGIILASSPMWTANDEKHYLVGVCERTITLSTSGVVAPQAAYIIFDSDGHVYGRALSGMAYAGPLTNGLLVSRPFEIDDEEWHVALQHLSDETTVGISVLKFKFGAKIESIKCVETDKALLIPSALPQVFDGRRVVEQGFAWWPPAIGAAVGASGALSGTFGYCAVYEWYDSNGERYQSASSVQDSVTLSSQKGDITVATLDCTAKPLGSVKIAIYRTIDSGNIYYRIGTIDNDPTVPSVTYTGDNTSDADLVDNEELYDGSELSNIPPPPHTVSCIHQERLVLAHGEWPETRIQYSKTFLPNTGVSHHPDLLITCSPDGGEITALESFQGQLIIFKSDRIFATYGQGYTATGSGTNYATPQLISEQIGCVYQKSIVRLPTGLAFRSRGGIHVLDKTGKVADLGGPVQYYLDTYDYHVGCVIADLSLAVWVSSDSGAPAIVYDYDAGLWCTWTNHQSLDAVVSSDGYLYRTAQLAEEEIMMWGREFEEEISNARFYGGSADASGDWAVVGAGYSWIGTDGAGRAYVYSVKDGAPVLMQTLQSASPRHEGAFGGMVAMSGNWMAITEELATTYNTQINFYRLDNGVWTFVHAISSGVGTDPPNGSGQLRRMVMDGDTLLLGDPAQGTGGETYVITRSGSTWSKVQTLTASDASAGDQFGFSVDLAGSVAVIGARMVAGAGSSRGQAYVFALSGTWGEEKILTPSNPQNSDYFGSWVAVAPDADTVYVANDRSGTGQSYLFSPRSGGTWPQEETFAIGHVGAAFWSADDLILPKGSSAGFNWYQRSGTWSLVGSASTNGYVYLAAIGDNFILASGHGYISGPNGMASFWKFNDIEVVVEDRDGFKDDGSDLVPLHIRTPWLTFAKQFGTQRVYRVQLLGQSLSDCGLNVQTAYDYDPVFVDGQSFDMAKMGSHYDADEHFKAGLAAGYVNKAMLLEVATSRQVVRAIMLDIVDEEHDGATVPDESYTLNAIGIELGLKTGTHRKDMGGGRRF